MNCWRCRKIILIESIKIIRLICDCIILMWFALSQSLSVLGLLVKFTGLKMATLSWSFFNNHIFPLSYLFSHLYFQVAIVSHILLLFIFFKRLFFYCSEIMSLNGGWSQIRSCQSGFVCWCECLDSWIGKLFLSNIFHPHSPHFLLARLKLKEFFFL